MRYRHPRRTAAIHRQRLLQPDMSPRSRPRSTADACDRVHSSARRHRLSPFALDLSIMEGRLITYLQFEFPYDGPWGAAMATHLDDLAHDIAAEDKLTWKIWTENRAAK